MECDACWRAIECGVDCIELNGVGYLKILGAQNPNFRKMPDRENKLLRVTPFTPHTNKPSSGNNSFVGKVIPINTPQRL